MSESTNTQNNSAYSIRPSVSRDGVRGNDVDTESMKKAILSIQDTRERREAIRKNIHLF